MICRRNIRKKFVKEFIGFIIWFISKFDLVYGNTFSYFLIYLWNTLFNNRLIKMERVIIFNYFPASHIVFKFWGRCSPADNLTARPINPFTTHCNLNKLLHNGCMVSKCSQLLLFCSLKVQKRCEKTNRSESPFMRRLQPTLELEKIRNVLIKNNYRLLKCVSIASILIGQDYQIHLFTTHP